MRLFSTIFVTYIFLLATVPSMSMAISSFKAKHNKTSCCHSKKEEKQKKPLSQQHKGCCDKGTCNPFMSCCNGHALISDSSISPYLAVADQQFIAWTENSISAFLADAWHPPKVV